MLELAQVHRPVPEEELKWQRLTLKYFGAQPHKPHPRLWRALFVDLLRSRLRGDEDSVQSAPRRFAARCVANTLEYSADSLNRLQRAVLDGASGLRGLIEQWKQTPKGHGGALSQTCSSLMHFAMYTGNQENIRVLFETGADINEGDVITGFTPLHVCAILHSVAWVEALLLAGADAFKRDAFQSHWYHYAELLGLLPLPHAARREHTSMQLMDRHTKTLQPLAVHEFEAMFNVVWTPGTLASFEYMEELMFSGFALGDRDMEFRRRYLPAIRRSPGDENVVLCRISEEVGFGVFAGRDFAEGEFILVYGGRLSTHSGDHRYCLASGLQEIVLDAATHRNLGGMVNHSHRPNAELVCIFHNGAERVLVLARAALQRGDQILIDYSETYWQDMAGGDECVNGAGVGAAPPTASLNDTDDDLPPLDEITPGGLAGSKGAGVLEDGADDDMPPLSPVQGAGRVGKGEPADPAVHGGTADGPADFVDLSNPPYCRLDLLLDA